MTVSGAVISYPWASNLVYRLTGSPVPAAPGAAARGAVGRRSEQPGPPVIPAELDRIWARAEQQVPTWSLLSMRLPNRPGWAGGVHHHRRCELERVRPIEPHAEQRQRRGRFSGSPTRRSSLGQKVRGWLRFAHTGELGGLTGQIIAGSAVLAASSWFTRACRSPSAGCGTGRSGNVSRSSERSLPRMSPLRQYRLCWKRAGLW